MKTKLLQRLMFGFSLLLSILVIFFISASCFIVLKRYYRNVRLEDSIRKERILREYKMVSFDSKTNVSTRGIASLYRDLGPDEYVYFHENDNHVLISNFGTHEYYCTSSCVCVMDEEVEEEGRRDGLLVLLGVVAIILAISEIGSRRSADEIIEEKCQRDFSLFCPSRRVIPKDSNCEDVLHNECQSCYEHRCEGKCRSPEADEEESGKRKKRKKKKKESKKEEEEEELRCEDDYVGGLDTRILLDDKYARSKVDEEFVEKYLEPFCEDMNCMADVFHPDSYFCDPMRPIIPDDIPENYPFDTPQDPDYEIE